MKKKNVTKSALLASVLAMVLCVTMLVGTTFAWFTDTASANVNKIQSGTLDVMLEYATEWNEDGSVKTWTDAEGQTLDFVKAKNAPENEAILWEPGCTYKLPERFKMTVLTRARHLASIICCRRMMQIR